MTHDPLEEYNGLAAITKVRSGLPGRDRLKVCVGLKRYSWPPRRYWHFMILGRAEAGAWFRTMNDPAEFKGARPLFPTWLGTFAFDGGHGSDISELGYSPTGRHGDERYA